VADIVHRGFWRRNDAGRQKPEDGPTAGDRNGSRAGRQAVELRAAVDRNRQRQNGRREKRMGREKGD
jgi:hypothetical protein